jgi:hypothetical protein
MQDFWAGTLSTLCENNERLKARENHAETDHKKLGNVFRVIPLVKKSEQSALLQRNLNHNHKGS